MPGFSTRAIRAASRVPDAPQAPLNVPIYQTATFEVADAAELAALLEFERPGHSYTRYSNPTHAALEEAVAELEGAAAGLATASGMAAIHALILSVLRTGDDLVMPRAVYGGMVGLAGSVLERSGIGHRAVDTTDLAQVEAAIGPRTGLVWVETISNPTTAVADIAALAELAHARGVLLAVDNTFASPALANPLALGADLVVHSATKFIAGHSDVVLGALLTRDDELYAVLKGRRDLLGAVPGPFETWLALRGLRTLPLRIERAQANAAELARRLRERPEISAVRYPGFGAILAIELAGGAMAADLLTHTTRLWVHATSLGGVESTFERRRRWRTEAPTIDESLVRMSVGIEHVDDLWDDLVQALEQLPGE